METDLNREPSGTCDTPMYIPVVEDMDRSTSFDRLTDRTGEAYLQRRLRPVQRVVSFICPNPFCGILVVMNHFFLNQCSPF